LWRCPDSSGSYSAIDRHHGQLMRVRDNQTLAETFHMETAIDPLLGKPLAKKGYRAPAHCDRSLALAGKNVR
ncbi:TPA: hypothetical protein ACP32P_003898, partial [Pseudomonas aeruginosa]